jgi:tetratricopeptide (TPR) repeat protein
LGFVYSKIQRKQEAIQYYEKALPISRALGDKENESSILSNLGSLYLALGHIVEAESCLEQSLIICRESGDLYGVSVNMMNLGTLHRHRGDAENGLRYYKDSVALKQTLNDDLGIAEVMVSLGGMYLDLSQYKEAITTLEEALKILECYESPLRSQVYEWLIEAQEKRRMGRD